MSKQTEIKAWGLLKARALEFLQRFVDDGPSGLIKEPAAGISINMERYVYKYEGVRCYDMLSLTRDCGTTRQDVYVDYPGFTGCIVYPLPGGEAKYDETPNKYVGDHLAERQQLAKHILDCLKQHGE